MLILTSYMKELTEQGDKVNNRTATHKDYINIQRLISDIEECYKEDIIKENECRIAMNYAYIVKNAMQQTLKA